MGYFSTKIEDLEFYVELYESIDGERSINVKYNNINVSYYIYRNNTCHKTEF